MTHICVSKLTIIGSDNGLSPDRRQAIILTNAGILLIGPLGTNFSEILIEILTFSFKKMRLKGSSAKRRPFCLGLNVLIQGQTFCHSGHQHYWNQFPHLNIRIFLILKIENEYNEPSIYWCCFQIGMSLLANWFNYHRSDEISWTRSREIVWHSGCVYAISMCSLFQSLSIFTRFISVSDRQDLWYQMHTVMKVLNYCQIQIKDSYLWNRPRRLFIPDLFRWLLGTVRYQAVT